MKKLGCLSFFVLSLLGCAFSAHGASIMGCSWVMPERFHLIKDYIWGSESDLLGPGILIFKDEYFDKDLIATSVIPSATEQKLDFRFSENGFEVLIYSEFVKGREGESLPSWVVIRREEGKGVFYLSGMSLVEVREFAKHCIPSIND